MKRIALFVLLLTIGVVVAASDSSAQNGMVSIDKVENTQYTDGTFQDGVPPRVLLRFNNDTGKKQNISNGWIITSYDGAQWDSVTMDSAGPIVTGENRFALYFNQVFDFWSGPLEAGDGIDPDTVGILGAGNPGTATRQMPAGYNDTAMAIIVWLNPAVDNHNKHICIDSAFWGAGGTWKWVSFDLIDFDQVGWSTSIAGQTYRVGTGTDATRNGWGFCFLVKDPTVGVNDVDPTLPTEFSVSQNYPNPFNPTTTIDYTVPRKSQVNLSVYNVLGQKVATLVDQEMAAGKYRAVWDGQADSGNSLSSGIYFYKFEADNFVKTTKMVMLK